VYVSRRKAGARAPSAYARASSRLLREPPGDLRTTVRRSLEGRAGSCRPCGSTSGSGPYLSNNHDTIGYVVGCKSAARDRPKHRSVAHSPLGALSFCELHWRHASAPGDAPHADAERALGAVGGKGAGWNGPARCCCSPDSCTAAARRGPERSLRDRQAHRSEKTADRDLVLTFTADEDLGLEALCPALQRWVDQRLREGTGLEGCSSLRDGMSARRCTAAHSG
jgi:hypothetical protein